MLSDQDLKQICAGTKTMTYWKKWIGLIKEAKRLGRNYVVEMGTHLDIHYYCGCLAQNAYSHWCITQHKSSYERGDHNEAKLILAKNLTASLNLPEVPDEGYKINIYDGV